jgi:hypothetical protein
LLRVSFFVARTVSENLWSPERNFAAAGDVGVMRMCFYVAVKKGSLPGSRHRRTTMKRLISSLELYKESEQELAALFSRVTARLTQTGRDTPERRNALASLETISHARAKLRKGKVVLANFSPELPPLLR